MGGGGDRLEAIFDSNGMPMLLSMVILPSASDTRHAALLLRAVLCTTCSHPTCHDHHMCCGICHGTHHECVVPGRLGGGIIDPIEERY